MIPWWIGNTFAVMVFMVVVFCISYVLLSADRISKNKKKIELSVLAMGAIGLIGLTADTRVETSSLKIQPYSGWIIGVSTPLRIQLNSTWSCNSWKNSEFSPDDFEERVRAWGDLCSWQKVAAKELNDLDLKTFPDLPKLITNGFPATTAKISPHLLDEHLEAVERYENLIIEVRQVQAKSKYSMFELLLSAFSPFLIAFAIALSGAKVLREET